MKKRTSVQKPDVPSLNKRQPFGKYLKEQLKSRPAVTAIMAVYLCFCIASFVYFPIIGRVRDYGFAVLYAVAVPIFYVTEYVVRQKTPWLCVSCVMFWLFGSFIGACYNVYTYIRCWDDIMHFFWGVVFTSAGFAALKWFMGEPENNKKFFGCVIFAFAFCLMIAVFWEIFEFAVDRISPNYDMQEDTYIFDINSFLLYPTYDHLHTEQINGIAYTVIHLQDGTEYRIEGYLDIGLFDTMWDIIWCTVSAAVLSIALTVDRFIGKHFYKLIISAETQKTVQATVETAVEAAEEISAEETE